MNRDVDIRDAPKHVEWLVDFLGRGWVRGSLTDFRGHPYRAHFRVNCHSLMPGLAAYYNWRASNEEARKIPDDAIELARHSAHIQALEDSWHVPPQTASKAYLRQRLRDQADVESTLFEFSVAYHHALQGHNVDVHSITVGSGFDLLVRSDSRKAEIECKTTTRGAGRKIHHKEFETLVANLWPALEATQQIYLVDVLCDDRLRPQDVAELSAATSQALSASRTGSFDVSGGRYSVSMNVVGCRTSPLAVDEADALVAPFWARATCRPHVFAALDSDAGGAPVGTVSLSLLVCRSGRPDNVLRPLMSALSKASKQLSGTCPSLVSIHIPEAIDWSVMKPQSALARELYGRFQRHRRLDVVSGVAFSLLPTDISRRAVLQGGTPAIYWANPRALHQLPEDFRPVRST